MINRIVYVWVFGESRGIPLPEHRGASLWAYLLGGVETAEEVILVH